MGVFKRYVKKATKAVKRAVRRRYIHKKSGAVKFRRIAKDVMYLKSIVNAEKKRIKVYDPLQVAVGQFKALTTTSVGNAYLSLDITPYPILGDFAYNRTGASIKLHSSFMRIRVDQQTANNMSGKLRVVMIQVKGVPQTSPAYFALSRVFQPESWLTVQTGGSIYPDGTYNTGSAIITANSNFNPDYKGEYTLLMDRKFKMPQRNYNLSNGQSGLLKEITIPWRWNRGKGHHIRYISTANPSPAGSVADLANGQIFMYILSDVGNSDSATNYTGTGSSQLPASLASTGYLVDYDFTHYFYDN